MGYSYTKEHNTLIFEEIQKQLNQLRLPLSGDLTKKEWTKIARHLNWCGYSLKPGRAYCTGKGVRNFYAGYLQKHRNAEDRSNTYQAAEPLPRKEITKLIEKWRTEDGYSLEKCATRLNRLRMPIEGKPITWDEHKVAELLAYNDALTADAAFRVQVRLQNYTTDTELSAEGYVTARTLKILEKAISVIKAGENYVNSAIEYIIVADNKTK